MQTRADPCCRLRLAAQTFCFLLLQPAVVHWRVVVITPHRRLNLGSTAPQRSFLEAVQWGSLDHGRQANLDAGVPLLNLPVRAEPELGERCRRILAERKDLEPVVLSMTFLMTHQAPQCWPGDRCRLPSRSVWTAFVTRAARHAVMWVIKMTLERFSQLSREEILRTAGLPLQQLRHTRAVQEILETGRQQDREAGRQQEAAAVAIRAA